MERNKRIARPLFLRYWPSGIPIEPFFLARFLIASLTTILFAGCANMQPLPTPTGKPEVTIQTTDVAGIKGAVVSKLAANGFVLGQDTAYSLAFSKQMEGGSAIFYQSMLGNSHSSTPQMNIVFTFAPQGGATRVFAHIDISMANAFGSVDKTNMDRGRAAHEAQVMLEQIKSTLESNLPQK